MRVIYINPNSTKAMTTGIVDAARAEMQGVEIRGVTNDAGPPAIEGAEDGAAALPGLLDCVKTAHIDGADAIIIACFDDTGLVEARASVPCPVLGIGQSSYVMAQLLGVRFSVVTSLAVSVPVIRANIENTGFSALCASVRASGLPVLTIEKGSTETRTALVREIQAARDTDGAEAVVLGCAGMAPLKAKLAAQSGVTLIDGVAASVHLALATVGFSVHGA